jgi:YHS domain-containing protein
MRSTLLACLAVLTIAAAACKEEAAPPAAKPEGQGVTAEQAHKMKAAEHAAAGHAAGHGEHAAPAGGAGSQPVQMAFDAPPAVGTVAKCPVSGEAFTVAADSARSEFEGKHFAFCCSDCKAPFDADPAKFAKK